jgi:hypothetical protein
MKVIGSIWFSTMQHDGIIGIVLIDIGREKKAYIGIGNGTNQTVDEQLIIRHGGIFPLKQAEELIGG